jgi:hypothetical protein
LVEAGAVALPSTPPTVAMSGASGSSCARCSCVSASPTPAVKFEVARSGSYEGTAASPDGRRLYAMLEEPLLLDYGKPEGRFLRVLELDTEKKDWTGRALRYPL